MHALKFRPALKLTRLLASVGLFSLFCPASAHATDYFLKLDGITGGSVARFHEGWSYIDSFNWSITSTGSAIGSGAGSAGRPVFSDFSWIQGLDSSITGLFSRITRGQHIPSAIVDFTNAQGQTYFKMTFDDVLLTNVALNGSVGFDPTIDGSFDYGKIKLDYWATRPDGSLGARSSAEYDLTTGKGSVAALAGVYAMGLSGPAVAPIPEPETYAMLLAGLGLLGVMARRRRAWPDEPSVSRC